MANKAKQVLTCRSGCNRRFTGEFAAQARTLHERRVHGDLTGSLGLHGSSSSGREKLIRKASALPSPAKVNGTGVRLEATSETEKMEMILLLHNTLSEAGKEYITSKLDELGFRSEE